MNKATEAFDRRMDWHTEGPWKGHAKAGGAFVGEYANGVLLNSGRTRELYSTRDLALDQLRKDLLEEALELIKLFAAEASIRWVDSSGNEQIAMLSQPELSRSDT